MRTGFRKKREYFTGLPTEAEWEYACRAGTSSQFSFGASLDSLDSYAWHYGNSDETYQRVGQKAANPWGIYDMHGNVAEWTLDEYSTTFYEGLTDSLASDPWQLPTRLHPRTVRGGAYDDNPDALRCGARLRSDLDWKRRDPQIPRSMWWNHGFSLCWVQNCSPVCSTNGRRANGILDERTGRIIVLFIL